MNYTDPSLKNFRGAKYIHLIKIIIGVLLLDMQLTSKYNKGVIFLLRLIDIYSKNDWVVSLNDKKVL